MHKPPIPLSRYVSRRKDSVTNNTIIDYYNENIKLLTTKRTHRLDVLKDEADNILTEEERIKTRWRDYLYPSQEGNNRSEETNLEDYTADPDTLLNAE